MADSLNAKAVRWPGRWAQVALAVGLAVGLTATSPMRASAMPSVMRAASAPTAAPVLPVDGSAAVGWGYNGAGAVGDSTTTTPRLSPVAVSGFADGIKQLSATWTHSLGLLSDGTVWAWGDNTTGDLGDGSQDNRSAPVQVPLTNVTQVAAGFGFSLAVRSDGTVWSWGDDSSATLGDGSISSTPRLSPVQVSGLRNAVSVAAGSDFAMALLSDGTVQTWGLNTFGQLGIGTGRPNFSPVPVAVPGLTGVRQIAAGGQFGLALLSDGTVRAWGENTNGYLGDGTMTTRFAPVPVPGLTGVTQVGAGSVHSMAVLSDGTMRTWGSNALGELGDGTKTTRLVPTPVPGLTGIVQATGGVFYTLAVRSDGTVRAWGDNSDGQLGIGLTPPQQLTPVPVPGLAHVREVNAAFGFALARLSVPAFSLALDQPSGDVAAGDEVTARIALAAVNGFTGDATLAVNGLPTGVTASLDANTVDALDPATVTFATSASSPTGTFTVSVTGTNDSVLQSTRTVTYQLTIAPPRGFTIALSPQSGTAVLGGSVTTLVSLTPVSGFAGTATVTVGGLPAGIGASLSTGQLSAGSPATLTLSASANSRTGTFPITVIAINTSVVEPVQTSTFQLTVALAPNFSIALTQQSATLSPGDSVTTSVTLTPTNGFSGTATLAATTLPAGVTASFDPGQVGAGNPATLTLSTSPLSPGGDFPIAITATNASAAVTRTITFELTISGGVPQPDPQ